MMKDYFQKNPRACGLFLSALSGGFCYWQYTSIMNKAAAGEKVSLSHLLAIFVAIFFMGVAMMAAGEKMQAWGEELKGREKTVKDYLLIAAFLLPGFAAYWWMQHILEGMGYVFK